MRGLRFPWLKLAHTCSTLENETAGNRSPASGTEGAFRLLNLQRGKNPRASLAEVVLKTAADGRHCPASLSLPMRKNLVVDQSDKPHRGCVAGSFREIRACVHASNLIGIAAVKPDGDRTVE